MTPELSEKGKHAKSVFFEKNNDVDVFVEDTKEGSKKLYSVIFERVFSNKYSIKNVFPLGGKDTVIRLCRKSQEGSKRLSLYVVDGDLGLLMGNDQEELKKLYTLKRYSIENYLLDSDAIILLLNEEDTEKRIKEIDDRFDFPRWTQENEEVLFELFILYAIANSVCCNVETVSYSVHKLKSLDSHGFVDLDKMAKRKQEVRAEVLEIISENELENKTKSIIKRAGGSATKKLHFVSGKDYLFPLLYIRMKKTTTFKTVEKVIKQRLAMKCDIDELKDAHDYLA